MAEIDCRNLSKSRGVFGLMASKTATEYLEGHSAVTHYFVSLFSYAPIMSLREAQKKVVVVFSFFFFFNFFRQNYIHAVAHNYHGKTKSHGTTNFTHGKTKLTHGKTKLTHGKTKLTHSKTKKRVGQRLLFILEMVCRVTVNKRNGDLCC